MIRSLPNVAKFGRYPFDDFRVNKQNVEISEDGSKLIEGESKLTVWAYYQPFVGEISPNLEKCK